MSIRKATLFAGSMLFTLAAAGYAAAQTSTPPSSPTVIVTGTRIPRPNLDQPVPVNVVTQQIIQNSGTPDLGQVIATLPSMGVQGTMRANSNSFGNSGGLSFPDLRNLGIQRTLTLVDGERHVAADPFSFAVDLGSIPPALVDRVEVVTGGASAIYGSDAIAGVVNIVMKKRFVGEQADFEGGVFPDGTYGYQEQGDFTIGRNFLNDRINVNATILWDSNQQILANQVPSDHNYGRINNPFFGGATPTPTNGVPEFLIAPNVESEFINNTGVLFDLANGSLTTFTPNGTPFAQQSRIATNSFAFGQFEPDCHTCFRTEDYELIIPKTDRVGGDVRLSYEITPHLEFDLDEKLIQREIYDFNQPSISFATVALSPDNAFITPAIRALDPFALNNGLILIDRFLGDGGARTTFARRITERVVPTLKGDFDARFAQVNWQATLNYGESINDLSNRNIELPGNFAASIDSVIDPATGQPACRINVPSAPPNPFNPPPSGIVGNPSACVPYNPFGLQNSRAAIMYSRTTEVEQQWLYQEVAHVDLNFDSSRFLNLPGGPIGVAGGVEWRKEKVVDDQDPLVAAGLTEVAPTPNFSGGFEVTEGYGELSAPVFKHQGFLLDELTFDVADRNAQYTTVGNVNAWKASVVYGPIPGLKLRGDYSVAVRAPDLTEAFLPPSGTFFTIADPCSSENIAGNPNREKNCALIVPGFTPGFTATTNLSPPGVVTGNDKLTPEQAKSYTLGFVLQPTFLKQFSLTVDYYNIDIKNAITEPTAQDIADNCVDSGSPDSQFCSLIQRCADPAGCFNVSGTKVPIGDIIFIRDTFLNASRLYTDGVEVQANYAFWVDPLHLKVSRDNDLPGKVSVDVDFNYLMHLHDFPFQTQPNAYIVEEGTAVNGTPYQRMVAHINYVQGPWSVTWTMRYVGTEANFNRNPGEAVYASNAILPAYFPAVVYHDVVVHYKLPMWKGGNADIYAGVNDLFNKAPPPSAITGNNGGPDGSALYDLGLYVFTGARVRY